jgi:hypothetical protein
MTTWRAFHSAARNGGRGRHTDFKLRETISPLLSQATARGAGQLDKPRESQPEGGRRFTSQTGRRHDGTSGSY